MMIKKFSLLLLALCLSLYSNAQLDLSGVVSTNDGKKVDHAVVTLKESLIRHFSDEKGKFTFFNTGGQDFVLGYHTPEELEKIRKATGLDIVWLKAEGQIY